MPYCTSDNGLLGTFIDENMASLGLPMPSSAFETAGSMTAIATSIAEVIEINGTSLSLYQALNKINSAKNALSVSAGITASYYLGALIGSMAVASGRCLANGATIADVIWTAREMGIFGSWLDAEYIKHPELLQKHQ